MIISIWACESKCNQTQCIITFWISVFPGSKIYISAKPDLEIPNHGLSREDIKIEKLMIDWLENLGSLPLHKSNIYLGWYLPLLKIFDLMQKYEKIS